MLLFRCFVVMLLPIALSACAMFTAWKSIPPPGGCDQCHTTPIGGDWQVTYKAAILSDERNRPYFQTPEYTMPTQSQPSSVLDLRKVEELKCFECHKSPTPAHSGRVGRFHH